MRKPTQYLEQGRNILAAAVDQAEYEIRQIQQRVERYRRAQATLIDAANTDSPRDAILALVEARAIASGAGRRGPLEALVDEAVGRLGYALVAEERGAA